jgi:hypothetical protein
VAAEASAYANPAPPQISKREHESSSLQMEHTINPHLPLEGIDDINSGHIRCGRAPGSFLACLVIAMAISWHREKGIMANLQLIRTMLNQAQLPKGLPDVQLVGVFRLRYRPQTSLTADWYRRQTENAAEYLKIYREIGPPAVKIRSLAKEDW